MLNSTYENARKAFYERRTALKSNHESDDYDCRSTDDFDDDDADCFCD